MLDEHAEGRPPVADVVLPEHGVALEGQDAGQRVADGRGAQVADVHLLGHVGRGVVDEHRLGRRSPRRPRGGGRPRPRPAATDDEVVGQGQVDEPGAADLHRRADAVEVGRRHHLFGHLAWRPAQLLAQWQGAVGLEVGAVRGAQDRVGAGRNRVERGLEPVGEHADGVGHPPSSHAPRRRRSGRAARAHGLAAGAPIAPSMRP